MAEKIARQTIVRQTTHPSESRSNIPTAELESFARPEEKRPATVRYPRDPTLDPQLVWKGKDEQDAHDLEVPAVPIYIQETIDPLALVEELRAESEGRRSQELGVFFDAVIVCTVTGSTHAGMVAGTALEGRGDRRVIGIDASKTLDKTVDQVTRICRFTAEAIGVQREIRADEITVVDGYAGPACGIPDEQTREAIYLAVRTEGSSPIRSTRESRWPASSAWSGQGRSRPDPESSMPTWAVNPRCLRTRTPLASAARSRATT